MKPSPPVQGLIGAVVVAAITWLLPDLLQVAFLAGLLWITVGIYLGMALMHGGTHARTEFLAGLPILALAMLAFWSPWALVAAWLMHPLWDLLHQWGLVKTHIHPSTVGFCIVFDVLVAGLSVLVATSII